LEAAGLGWPDAASDLVRFLNPGTDTHAPTKDGHGVNVSFAQSALPGVFDAFDFPFA